MSNQTKICILMIRQFTHASAKSVGELNKLTEDMAHIFTV